MLFVREIHSTLCALAEVEASCEMKENFTANTCESSQRESQHALSEHVTDMQVRVRLLHSESNTYYVTLRHMADGRTFILMSSLRWMCERVYLSSCSLSAVQCASAGNVSWGTDVHFLTTFVQFRACRRISSPCVSMCGQLSVPPIDDGIKFTHSRSEKLSELLSSLNSPRLYASELLSNNAKGEIALSRKYYGY